MKDQDTFGIHFSYYYNSIYLLKKKVIGPFHISAIIAEILQKHYSNLHVLRYHSLNKTVTIKIVREVIIY